MEKHKKITTDCKRCGGTGMITVSDGDQIKHLYCSCRGLLIAKRLLGPSLFQSFKPNDSFVKQISKNPKLDSKQLYIKFTNEDKMRKLIAFYVFRKKFRSFKVTDSSLIMDIFLGKDSEYRSSRELVEKNDALFVRLGKTEVEMNKFDEVFCSFLSLAELKSDLHLWLYSTYAASSNCLKQYYERFSMPVFSGSGFDRIKI